MDIYSYLNSKDVAEHCRKINHQFDAIGTAFIINACRHISLEEKLRLYQEIINTMPDETVHDHARMLNWNFESIRFDADSIFKVLSYYISEMRQKKAAFLQPEPDTVYQWEYYRRDWKEPATTKHLYSRFDAAKTAMMHEITERCSGESADSEDATEHFTGFIEKRQVDADDYFSVTINENGDITYLYDSQDDVVNMIFESLWVKIPVPFKEGDLLYGANPHTLSDQNIGKEPMVFTSCCYDGLDENEPRNQHRMSGWDASDMTAWGYWLCDDGRLYEECMHSYYDLEYYRGEIKGNVRVLKALSAQMKGEIDAHMLMIAYDAVLREREINNVFPSWDYLPECYEKMSIADIHEKYELWKKYDREESEND